MRSLPSAPCPKSKRKRATKSKRGKSKKPLPNVGRGFFVYSAGSYNWVKPPTGVYIHIAQDCARRIP